MKPIDPIEQVRAAILREATVEQVRAAILREVRRQYTEKEIRGAGREMSWDLGYRTALEDFERWLEQADRAEMMGRKK